MNAITRRINAWHWRRYTAALAGTATEPPTLLMDWEAWLIIVMIIVIGSIVGAAKAGWL